MALQSRQCTAMRYYNECEAAEGGGMSNAVRFARAEQRMHMVSTELDKLKQVNQVLPGELH
jgi:hypothetical protein